MKREFQTENAATYLHLMQVATDMFEPDELERLSPRTRGGKRLAELNGEGIAGLEPIATTEAIAYDFLSKGGKHSRPFLTLATYHALREVGNRDVIPDHVRRVALSIETFHKASLVHDDIEDDDPYRYGDPTLHATYGVPTAINVGDFLIGLGYRLVSRDAAELGSEAAADILDTLADAHLRLAEGQGAELAWRDARNKRLPTKDALKIYALKTAPAFEAAIYCGARLAGPAEAYKESIRRFTCHLGIGFQILNDLKDWRENAENKMEAGGDVLGGRPTLLLALALEKLSSKDATKLIELISEGASDAKTLCSVRKFYEKANVFVDANRLVDSHYAQAETIANALDREPFRELARWILEIVLERPSVTESEPIVESMAS